MILAATRAVAVVIAFLAVLSLAESALTGYLGWLADRAAYAKWPPLDRNALKPGDALIFRTQGWAARLIQAVTWSRWNHAAIYVGHGLLIEAQPAGVKIVPLSNYPDDSRILASRWYLPPDQRAAVVHAALSYRDSSYGWVDDLALGLVHLGFRPSLLDRFAARDDRLCCSQLVAYAYDRAGASGWLSGRFGKAGDRAPWCTAPSDIASAVLSYGPNPVVRSDA